MYICFQMSVRVGDAYLRCPIARVAGAGAWLNPRGGYRYDPSLYNEQYRGGSFADTFRRFLAKALALLRTHVLPIVKRHGPMVAKAMSNYAVSQGKAYLDRSKKEGPIAAAISQALEDLPSFTARVVRKFEETERGSTSDERGGGPQLSPGELSQLVQALIVNCMPVIRQRVDETIRPKLEAAITYSNPVMYGNTWGGHMQNQADVGRIINSWAGSQSDDCLDVLCSLLENMMHAGIFQSIRLEQASPMRQITNGAMNIINHGSTQYDTQRTLRQLRMGQSLEDKSDDCAALYLLLRGLGDMSLETSVPMRASVLLNRLSAVKGRGTGASKPPKQLSIESAQDRGGFIGLGLASVLVPALAAGIPAVASAVSDIVHTWRGAGAGVGLPQGYDDMEPVVNQILNYLSGMNIIDVLKPRDIIDVISQVRDRGYEHSAFDQNIGRQVQSLLKKIHQALKQHSKSSGKPPVKRRRF